MQLLFLGGWPPHFRVSIQRKYFRVDSGLQEEVMLLSLVVPLSRLEIVRAS